MGLEIRVNELSCLIRPNLVIQPGHLEIYSSVTSCSANLDNADLIPILSLKVCGA